MLLKKRFDKIKLNIYYKDLIMLFTSGLNDVMNDHVIMI